MMAIAVAVLREKRCYWSVGIDLSRLRNRLMSAGVVYKQVRPGLALEHRRTSPEEELEGVKEATHSAKEAPDLQGWTGQRRWSTMFWRAMTASMTSLDIKPKAREAPEVTVWFIAAYVPCHYSESTHQTLNSETLIGVKLFQKRCFKILI